MGLFNSGTARTLAVEGGRSLFSALTSGTSPIIPGGANSVQAVINAANPPRNGVPAEAPTTQNGLRQTDSMRGSLFGGVPPVMLAIGAVVALAVIVAMVRK